MAGPAVAVISGGLYHCTPAWTSARPQHADVYRVYLPVSGSARVALGEAWTDLAPGLLYLIPAHPALSFACRHRMDVHWMHLRVDDPALARLAERLDTVRSWPSAHWRWAEPALARLDEHLAGGDAALAAAVHAVALAVIAAAVDPGGAARERAAAAQGRFQGALALMDRRYPASVRAASLASAVGMSEVHFRRAFRQAFGMPPHAYLARRRLEAAVSMLSGSQEPIAAIAEACGYPDAFYFSRVFKRQYRLSPQAFRRARQRAP